jgi:mannitol-1-phosphate 5-dehydrogenase
LFNEAGYQVVLVDESAGLVSQLASAGRYTVVRAESSGRREDVVIAGYRALSTAQSEAIAEALAAADLVAVAVFPQNFRAVAAGLAGALVRRRAQRPDTPLDVLLCTNLAHAGPQFRTLLVDTCTREVGEYIQARVGVVETLVIRIVAEAPAEVRQREPLLVWTNGYPELPVDRHAFKGDAPRVPGLRLVDDMRAEELRKLYTYNTFQAALAYLGARRGYRLIVECMADPQVHDEAEAVLDEASRALQAAYGFSGEDMARWTAGVVTQTNNPVLGDTVARMGADPRRKLKREDRLIGPILLARQYGVDPTHLVRAAAAGLHFTEPQDAGAAHVQERIATLGLLRAVRELCGLNEAEEDLVRAIMRAYRRLPMDEEWARKAQQAYELGFNYEKVYHGCGQCSLAAILETLDRFADPAFEAATGLAGGLGLAGDVTCSALTGAVLSFGLVYPRRRAQFDGDRDNKYRTYAMTQRLRERYLERYGTLTCHEIHLRSMGRAFDLRDPAEREAFEAAGAHDDKCTGVVAQAARWAVEIIGEEMVEEAMEGDE